MRKINTKKIFIIGFFSLLVILSVASFVRADNLQNAFKGDTSPLNQAADKAGYKPVDQADVMAEQLIGDIIQMVLSFIGVIFLILMIYGGYMWMLARGNEQQVEKAKQLILAAIIGVIIVLASYAVSYFVLQKFGGAALQQDPQMLQDWNVGE